MLSIALKYDNDKYLIQFGLKSRVFLIPEVLICILIKCIQSADYIISFGPLRSVKIFRVLKVICLEPSSKHCLNYLTTFRHVSLI